MVTYRSLDEYSAVVGAVASIAAAAATKVANRSPASMLAVKPCPTDRSVQRSVRKERPLSFEARRVGRSWASSSMPTVTRARQARLAGGGDICWAAPPTPVTAVSIAVSAYVLLSSGGLKIPPAEAHRVAAVIIPFAY
ncbi:hypothetical protein MTO96_034895 [Rhipicephalus appendiculatus]